MVGFFVGECIVEGVFCGVVGLCGWVGLGLWGLGVCCGLMGAEGGDGWGGG